jgi:hypothetical protein
MAIQLFALVECMIGINGQLLFYHVLLFLVFLANARLSTTRGDQGFHWALISMTLTVITVL